MLKVTKESKKVTKQFRGVVERCCFCRSRTKHWYEEFPICQTCATIHKKEQLPKHVKLLRPKR